MGEKNQEHGLLEVENDQGEDDMDTTCPVCYLELDDNEITCHNGHNVCSNCIRELVQDKGACKQPSTCGCTGFVYQCPLCRCSNLLRASHINAIVKGGWGVWEGGKNNLKDGSPKSSESSLPPLGPGKQPAQIDGEKAIKSSLSFGFSAFRLKRKSEPKKDTIPKVVLTDKGYTTTCCACRKKGIHTPSVSATGKLLALSCSEGHTLCVECSRDLVKTKGGCRNPDCKSCSKVINASFKCPECETGYSLERRHMMVIMRGRWDSRQRNIQR